MTFKLLFHADALKEWEKLDGSIRAQFKKKLMARLDHPQVPASRLHHLDNCYKIKLKSSGWRMVYQVQDEVISVLVFAVGKREDNAVYETAAKRIH